MDLVFFVNSLQAGTVHFTSALHRDLVLENWVNPTLCEKLVS